MIAELKLIECIKSRTTLDDDALHDLLTNETADVDRKALTMGLFALGLITRDQCGLCFYAFDMKEV